VVQQQITTTSYVRFFLAATRKQCDLIIRGVRAMQADMNTFRSSASHLQHNPQFLYQIPVTYGDRSVYPPLGILAFAHLLNNLLPSVGGPSTQPLVRSLTCPPDAVRSLQTSKDSIPKAHATPKILKTICETIAGNIDCWFFALDSTPNNAWQDALPEGTGQAHF
jgi:hypothetical protein